MVWSRNQAARVSSSFPRPTIGQLEVLDGSTGEGPGDGTVGAPVVSPSSLTGAAKR